MNLILQNSTESVFTGHTILIIDDDPAILSMMADYLETYGFKILVAQDGGTGLERAQFAQPDLILLDIMMPGIDGFETCRRLKLNSVTKEIPAIFMTALTATEHKIMGFQVGAVDYITKPIQNEELMVRIRTHLRLRDLTERLEQKVQEQTEELTGTNEHLQQEIAQRKWVEEALRASEKQLRRLFEQSSDAVFIHSLDGQTILNVNNRACELLGYSKEQLQSMTISMLHPETEIETSQKALRRIIDKGYIRFETQFKKADGTIVDVDISSSIIDEEGIIQGIARDVTGRKQVEETLEQRAAQLTLLNDIGKRIAAELELDSVLERAACLVQESFGYHHVALFTIDREQNELVMKARAGDFDALFPLEHRIKMGKGMNGWVARHGQRILANDVNTEPRYVNFFPDVIPTQSELSVPIRVADETVGVLDVQSPQLNAFGQNDVLVIETLADQIAVAIKNARLYQAVEQELVERKQMEEAVRKERDKAQRYLDIVGAIIVTIDADQKVSLINRRGCEILGYESETIIGKKWFDNFIPEWDRAKVKASFLQLMAGEVEPVEYFENAVLTKSGQERIIAWHNTVLLNETGEIIGTLSAGEDVTEHKQAEEALQKAEARYRNLFEEAPVMYVITHNQSRTPVIADCNQLFANTLGYSRAEIVGQPLAGFYTPESQTELFNGGGYERALAGDFSDAERKLLTRDGRIIETLLHASPEIDPVTGQVFGTRAMFVDITERKQAEETLKEYSERLAEMVEERTQELQEAQEQLIRREKLAVLGQMAGGVAHELRNPLGAISNAIYFLKMVLSDADEPVGEYLNIILSEIRKSDMIISDLLNFSRSRLAERAEREEIAVSALVARVLAEQPPPESIEVSTRIAPDLPPIFADPRHVGQALTNLVTNACQAMPKGGKLTISAKAEENQVALSITDTGSGIAPENMKRLFEPLFTTKARGIGLGLVVTKNLVEANGGCIEVESEEGKGSIFMVYLPLTRDTNENQFTKQ